MNSASPVPQYMPPGPIILIPKDPYFENLKDLLQQASISAKSQEAFTLYSSMYDSLKNEISNPRKIIYRASCTLGMAALESQTPEQRTVWLQRTAQDLALVNPLIRQENDMHLRSILINEAWEVVKNVQNFTLNNSPTNNHSH